MNWSASRRRPSPDERLDAELRDQRLAIAGAVVGMVGARSVASVMQSLLCETAAVHAPTYAAAAAFLLLVAAAAAALPAIRAARVSPMTALRDN